jgi:hypothetical protein
VIVRRVVMPPRPTVGFGLEAPHMGGCWLYRKVETLRPPPTFAPLVALDRPIPVADLLP